ncbi:hypothetical protein [Rhabdochromatium marinum]|uniref:hypothetical protein n=1 Tax=Rhabdochromatium marinum TaxID=48729 RepID=UPI001904EF63|nr:hypothetical protein [Rhabdochromatium marinum]MBK1650312.1 hypothetical protein [Rhabdochromatium marinum]
MILTDYDTVVHCDEPARSGTLHYCSPEVQQRQDAQLSDDLFALAATFFQLLTNRPPFLHDEELRKDLGLNWAGEAERFPRLRGFFDRATALERTARFASAREAWKFLTAETSETSASRTAPASRLPTPTLTPTPIPTLTLSEQQVPWLQDVLSAYPGSRYGNRETRGLDSEFALATYVETRLDQVLREDIERGAVNLVILFGNAGDGKTALLQYLACQLSGERIDSAQRVWEHRLANGQRLKINLDGSASWNGQCADDLLDDLFAPFHQPDYSHDRTHIVAINSGKLLEWLDRQTQETYLTEQLREALLDETPPRDARLRLIDLNQRSLVGGFDARDATLSSDFFDTLLARLFGGRDIDHWAVCPRCTAQARCTAWASVQIWRDPEQGARFKTRLLDALQACHQRGEIHITARELRAALSYIFFGLEACADRHAQPDRPLEPAARRVFDPNSPGRQGELLRELTRLDPALDSDPDLDRELLSVAAHPAHPDALAQARRCAYFERPDGAVILADGQHYGRFRAAAGLDAVGREALCRDLCAGIACLEALPRGAKPPTHGLPLRVTPRTPTESALWVIKPWERFDLEIPHSAAHQPLEMLPTHVTLCYRLSGGSIERLRIDLELFHRLLELKHGLQLMGRAEEGRFANLALFIQRLAQEDFRELYAWHPAEDERVWRLQMMEQDGRQQLVREVVE